MVRINFNQIILTGLLLCLSFGAHAKLNVFACEPEWGALTKELGGDKVSIYTATTAFQDPHFIEARPSLIAKVRSADLVVCTGADLEIGWLPLLLRKASNQKVLSGESGHFMAADFVKKIEVPHKHDRSHGDVHAEGNPHVHLDPNNIKKIAKRLYQRLKQLDSGNAEYYETRYKQFNLEWIANILRWEKQFSELKNRQFVVQHRNWSYLFKWLGIQEAADLEPKPGLPPTSAHLAKVLSSVNQENVQGIIVANYQDARGAEWLAKKTNLPLLALPFTVGGEENVSDLAQLFEFNLSKLLEVARIEIANADGVAK